MLISEGFVDNFLPKFLKMAKKFGNLAESHYLCNLIGGV